jgi:type II secretory pathway component GspD/PulD (secretin)
LANDNVTEGSGNGRHSVADKVASVLNQVFADARLARPPVIVADRRTNSLIIRARRSELEAIGRMLGHDWRG